MDISAEPDTPVNAPTTEPPAAAALRLSVVIASSNDAALLVPCVEALQPQASPDTTEVLVVRAVDRPCGSARTRLAAAMPALRWIDAPEGSTVPRLRGLGIAAARADKIAMLEDDCVAAAGWCARAQAAGESSAATGGAVEPGPYERVLDWAVYFCEYGRFMLPLANAPNAPLTGNNVVYARPAIAGLAPALQADFREAFVHALWQREGVPTSVDAGLIVTNVNRWSGRHLTAVPFHHGRAYAAERFGQRGLFFRVGLALLALGLPVLKTARLVRETTSRKRFVGRLVVALPWILVFVTSWSAGEIAGCLLGAGHSAERWR